MDINQNVKKCNNMLERLACFEEVLTELDRILDDHDGQPVSYSDPDYMLTRNDLIEIQVELSYFQELGKLHLKIMELASEIQDHVNSILGRMETAASAPADHAAEVLS